jgi:hypothetical protein
MINDHDTPKTTLFFQLSFIILFLANIFSKIFPVTIRNHIEGSNHKIRLFSQLTFFVDAQISKCTEGEIIPENSFERKKIQDNHTICDILQRYLKNSNSITPQR